MLNVVLSIKWPIFRDRPSLIKPDLNIALDTKDTKDTKMAACAPVSGLLPLTWTSPACHPPCLAQIRLP